MIKNLKNLDKFNDQIGKYRYPVCDKDFDKASYLAHLIEHSRNEERPEPGDVVICRGPKKHYHSGHMERCIEELASVCVLPHTPNVGTGYPGSPEEHKIHFSTSGGYWLSCPDEDMFVKQPAKREKTFWTWGHRGWEAGGGVYFKAEVNVWSLFLESIY